MSEPAEIIIGPDDDESLFRSNGFIWPKGRNPDGKLIRPERALPGVVYTCMKCSVKLARGRSPKPHDNPFFKHPRIEGGCTGESIVHLAAKHNLQALLRYALAGHLRLGVQSQCPTCKAWTKVFPVVTGSVVKEFNDPTNGRAYDVALVADGRVTAAFEVMVTHPVDERKAADFAASGIPWFEIEANMLLVRRIEELLDKLEDVAGGDGEELPALILPARRVPHACVVIPLLVPPPSSGSDDGEDDPGDDPPLVDQEAENRLTQTRRSAFAAELAKVFATTSAVVLRTSEPCPVCGSRGLEVTVSRDAQRKHYHRVAVKHHDEQNGTTWDVALLRENGSLALGIMVVLNEAMHSPLHIGVPDSEISSTRWIAVPIFTSRERVVATGLSYEPGSRAPIIRCNNQELSPKAAKRCGTCELRQRQQVLLGAATNYGKQFDQMVAEMASAAAPDQVTSIANRYRALLTDLAKAIADAGGQDPPEPQRDIEMEANAQRGRLWAALRDKAALALSQARAEAHALLVAAQDSPTLEVKAVEARSPFVKSIDGHAHALQQKPAQYWEELVAEHRSRITRALAAAAAERVHAEELKRVTERAKERKEAEDRRLAEANARTAAAAAAAARQAAEKQQREESERQAVAAYEALASTRIVRVRERIQSRIRGAESLSALASIARGFLDECRQIMAEPEIDHVAPETQRTQRTVLMGLLRDRRVLLVEEASIPHRREAQDRLSPATSLKDLERLAAEHREAWIAQRIALRRRIDEDAEVIATRTWDVVVDQQRLRIQGANLRTAWEGMISAVKWFSLGANEKFSMQEDTAGEMLVQASLPFADLPAWLTPIVGALKKTRRRREDEVHIRALIAAAMDHAITK